MTSLLYADRDMSVYGAHCPGCSRPLAFYVDSFRRDEDCWIRDDVWITECPECDEDLSNVRPAGVPA